MKKISSLIFIFHFLSIVTYAQSSFIGHWVGSFGNGEKNGPNYYSFQFNTDGSFQVIDAGNRVIATGTFRADGNRFTSTYNYTTGGTYSVSGAIDNDGTLYGEWGSGKNTSGGGRWVMTRKQSKIDFINIERKTKIVSQKNNTPANPYDFSRVKMCIDRTIPVGSLPNRNFSAIKPLPRINADGSYSEVGVTRQALAAETNKMWDPGQTITVFLDNSASQRIQQKVQFYAFQWEKIANVKFAFVTDRSIANIKVSFVEGDGSWSWIGKEVLTNPLGLNTMNFGWFNDATPESDFRSTVQHEFGHALGFIHEHQSPASGIPWDKEKCYAFFGGEPNKWSRAEVDFNVFNKYARISTNFSTYDRLSIMHYTFPSFLTTDGSFAPMNTDFSAVDRQYSNLIYPFPPNPTNATGILRTGDDCDEILFSVEYNVVDADKVEFVISLGSVNGNSVSWWKQIGIPGTNNSETTLWVQNHSLIASENRTRFSQQIPFTQIDRSRGISFWKGKLAGVHTLLGYKWNILPCVTGGSRVSLIWRKDRCF